MATTLAPTAPDAAVVAVPATQPAPVRLMALGLWGVVGSLLSYGIVMTVTPPPAPGGSPTPPPAAAVRAPSECRRGAPSLPPTVSTTSRLFEPLTLRGTTFRNRVWLAPMCQYSATDGVPDDWHLVHLGTRAVGGFGLVLAEATAVVPEGRITPQDTGLWNDAQTDAWARIVRFVQERGARAGVQLAHAGRKASTYSPFDAQGRRGTVPADDGGWGTVGPSASAFPGYDAPRALTAEEIAEVPAAFAAAAERALRAGFDVVEVHAAHGYLLHQFLSPLSNERTDEYGGPLENRARLLTEVVEAVRAVWPEDRPLFVRVSATDWVEGGLDVADVAQVATVLRELGVDLVDVSTGGNAPAEIPVGPGYQVPHARLVREVAKVPVAAVGLLTSAEQAEGLVVDGAADAVMLGREALRDPMWPLRAAHRLGVPASTAPDAPARWQPQLDRATWR
ncbi:NADH:flavin oxidoreductase/NADH oxidase [Actinotalea solisilvae]|uniref:NADH:flavin oxidoreductase/NADH oxidase n=1 Tax=Actinotalea solisilvae TaxID=2072922 RepID=UPI001F47472F|nr:NADH:flavin oxidoreductase/NADH oxidase [Actinotalea solisilvae]